MLFSIISLWPPSYGDQQVDEYNLYIISLEVFDISTYLHIQNACSHTSVSAEGEFIVHHKHCHWKARANAPK